MLFQKENDLKKTWRDLEKTRVDLDFETTTWAKNARGEFPDGDAGDLKFSQWCIRALDPVPPGQQIQQLIVRARAADICKDEKTYAGVGGFKSIKHLIGLPKREQLAVLSAAKLSHRNVQTVKREREVLNAALGAEPPPERNSPMRDLATLSRWVYGLTVKQKMGLPVTIRDIVERYRDL